MFVNILIMYQRLCKLSNTNSFFLFGARGTGKTTLLTSLFDDKSSLFIDLLDIEVYDELLLDSSRFRALINLPEHAGKRIVVDEVQRMPRLLDVVHSEIHQKKRQFILTGSSSRRLKQSGTNLLAGRAWVYNLYPLTSLELGDSFDLSKALQWGSLPEAYLAPSEEHAREYLMAYVNTYLEKEIQQEQWVRKLAPFRKFLAIAAQMNGCIMNKSSIAKDVGVDDVTVANYFEILEDTLVGIQLPAYHRSVRKVQRQASKFYFIDPGMKRGLQKILSVGLHPQTSAWGEAFEHWIVLEFIKLSSYKRYEWSFYYVRTKDNVEIDLVIERPGQCKLLVEIKSKTTVRQSDAKALETLGVDIDSQAEKWLISNDTLEQQFGSTRALHWQKALRELFS